MDFETINSTYILDGVVQEIGSEGSFVNIYLERERYLLNADEILEEMLGK